MVNDRLLRVARPGQRSQFRWLHHIDVVTNLPKTTSDRTKALRLSSETAETIRFNLTARGWKVKLYGDAE